MLTNRSAPAATVTPVLIYEDVPAAIDWLCATFGFTERLRATDPDGRVSHAQIAVGEGAVILSYRSGAHGLLQQAEPKHAVHVRVSDVDRHFEHAQHRGAKILLPVATYPYGERQYAVEDLEGHRWTFSQTVADVAAEDWGGTTAPEAR